MHYFKECPVDGSGRNGSKWKTYNWGYSKDDLIEMFTKHLYNKHRMSGKIAESAIALAEYCTYTEDPPHSQPPAPRFNCCHRRPPRSLRRRSSKKIQRKDNAKDEPPRSSADDSGAVEATVEQDLVSVAAVRGATDAMHTAVEHAESMGSAIRRLCVALEDAGNTFKSATAVLTTLIDKPHD